MKPIALIFFSLAVVAIITEALLYRRIRKQKYDWRESLTSFGVAVGQRLTKTAMGGLLLGVSLFVYEHRLFHFSMTPTTWVALFFLQEFTYYWMHRMSHEVRWLWASHSVHHSVHQLTLSSSYRLGWTSALSGTFVFWLPLVWLGFTPFATFTMLGLNLLYQFWLHTELVPKLGPLEWILNTPSNHRVHHSRNEIYLDKNYGGVIVIFDHLFGTYIGEKKEEPCVYGLVGKEQTFNVFRVALREWFEIAQNLRNARSLRQVGIILFGRPGAMLPPVASHSVSLKNLALWISLLSVGVTSSFAVAQGGFQGIKMRLAMQFSPCSEDLKKYCEGVEPGEGRILKCLEPHFGELSQGCRAQFEKRGVTPEQVMALFNSCGADAKKHCASAKPGDGKFQACLSEHEKELTPECRGELAKLPSKTKTN